MAVNIVTPKQLVDEFKKSGEFDRLRRELLSQFKNGDSSRTFIARVEDIARQKLDSDRKLQYMSQDAVHAEVMQELERYPLVERAVTDMPILSDPSFPSSIRSTLLKIMGDDGEHPDVGVVNSRGLVDEHIEGDKAEDAVSKSEVNRNLLDQQPVSVAEDSLFSTSPQPPVVRSHSLLDQQPASIAEDAPIPISPPPPVVLDNGIDGLGVDGKAVVNGSLHDDITPSS